LDGGDRKQQKIHWRMLPFLNTVVMNNEQMQNDAYFILRGEPCEQ